MARISILVQVNTDPVPGWGNDPEDYAKHIRHHLESTIPHYDPKVTLLPDMIEIRVPSGSFVYPTGEKIINELLSQPSDDRVTPDA